MTTIVLHLGAHRTGSSFIQSSFDANKDVFASHGIGFQYFHLVSGLREATVAARQAAQAGNEDKFEQHFEKIDNFLRKRAASGRDIEFLSYEGFLGPIDLSQGGVIYPYADKMAKRIFQTLKGLTDTPIRVLFCVRDIASFVESTYLYCARGGMQYSFEKYKGALDLERLSWVPVLQSLHQSFGAENVITWSHEAFRQDKDRVLEWAFDQTAIGASVLHQLTFPNSSVNSSITARSLAVAEVVNKIVHSCNETDALSQHNKRRLAGRLNRAIDRQLADLADARPSLLSAQEKQRLSQNYAADVQWIKQNMAGTSMI